jgi:hypothetical protein
MLRGVRVDAFGAMMLLICAWLMPRPWVYDRLILMSDCGKATIA